MAQRSPNYGHDPSFIPDTDIRDVSSRRASLGLPAREGFTVSELDALLKAIDSEIVGWIDRGVAQDKLDAIGRVIAHAAETFGSARKAERWLKRPNRLLDSRPLDRIEHDPQAIDDELIRIDHGVYS